MMILILKPSGRSDHHYLPPVFFGVVILLIFFVCFFGEAFFFLTFGDFDSSNVSLFMSSSCWESFDSSLDSDEGFFFCDFGLGVWFWFGLSFLGVSFMVLFVSFLSLLIKVSPGQLCCMWPLILQFKQVVLLEKEQYVSSTLNHLFFDPVSNCFWNINGRIHIILVYKIVQIPSLW